MADYNQVRDAIADTVRGVFGSDMNVTEEFPKSVVPPAAVIQPEGGSPIKYGKSFGGGCDDYELVISLIVGQVNEKSAQQYLGELISRNSPLLKALRALRPGGTGCVFALSASKRETMIGKALYAYARIAVTVRA